MFLFFLIFIIDNNLALDIFRKSRLPTMVLHDSKRYIITAYILPLIIIIMTCVLNFLVESPESSLYKYRPNYGRKVCAINSLRAHLMFVTLPAFLSCCFNLMIFILTIITIKMEVRAILNATNSTRTVDIAGNKKNYHFQSYHQRFIWYLKLSVLLGVLHFFTFTGDLFFRKCHIISYFLVLLLSAHGKFDN